MTDDDDGPQPEYSLILPFVVADDGTYDPPSFVAGFECGLLWNLLDGLGKAGAVELVKYVPTDVVRQVDLIAMHYGLTLAAEPWEEHPDAWTKVTIRTP